MTIRDYDLIIIGTGSGNAIPPELQDKKIALIEKGRFGGTCLNVGCIPTKMFVHAADTAFAAAHSEHLSLSTQFTGVHWAELQQRVFGRIDPIASGGEEYRREHADNAHIDVYDGQARFIGDRTVDTGVCSDGQRYQLRGAEIVIAAGARPHIPEVIAESGVDYHTNETIMRLPEFPQRLTVLGGGFIAVEFAHIFSSLGAEVTLINRSAALLRHLDAEVSAAFTEVFGRQVRLVLDDPVAAAEQDAHGVHITTTSGARITGDALLVATGRTPNGDMLNAAAAGLDMDGSRILVDEYGRTNQPGIWALGDVSSPYQLKHVANNEARAVFHNLTHPDQLRAVNHEHVPAAVFTHPQVAYVGMTEVQARQWAAENSTEITTKVQYYRDIAFGWALEDTDGFLKLIADQQTGLILGAWIMGYEAAALLQPLIQAMVFRTPARELATRQYWIHPALPELVENALLGLDVPA